MNDPDSKLQKVLAALVCCMCVFFMGCGSTHGHTAAENYSKMTPEEIVDSLTLEQKTAQMLLPAVYNIDEQKMSEIDYGAVLSKKESLPASEWRITVDQLQTAALDSQAAVPYLYGQDDVHGVNYCLDTVIFPHNIALGAANDPELTKDAGRITAMEAARCHMLWNFAPTVAVSCDPRWERTYECYSSDPEIVKNLGRAYTEGLVENGVVACAKHFLADGSTIFGTGPDYYPGRLIDRGNAELSEEELKELLGIYQAQIDAGVQTIMISDSSVNGIRMSEHKELLRYLKEDMGFDGFLVTDWNAVKTTSAETYKEKIITVINSGTDMLMEVDSFEEVHRILIDAVYNGDIPQSRIDDAARRIIKVKKGIKKGKEDAHLEAIKYFQVFW